MKLFRHFFILLVFVAVFFIRAAAQNDNSVLNRIMAKTAKNYNDYPIEKVYLHFDKPYYAVGDTMWFKAYLTIDRHQPSILSKIIYVDVLGPRDSLIQSIKLQVKNATAWSFIPISSLSGRKGNYRVVAYTNWMNNSDLGYFFNKTITVGDVINNNLSTQISLKSSVTGKSTKITAGIYYKNNDGVALVDKKVSWTVQKEDDVIAKGKAQTDKNGFAEITFLNVKNINLDSAKLTTLIDNSDHKDISSTFSLKPVAKPNDMQFFPEGGELLIGVRSKVAFKAIKPDGLGTDVKGTITDNEGKIAAEFSSAHLGMGFFMFTPEDGKTYTTHVTYADGSSGQPALPKIQNGGINLSLDNSRPDTLGLKLLSDASFFEAYKDQTFFILAKSSGVICYAAKTQLKSLVYSAEIPKSKFPTGILQVTLFTADGDPVTERISFIQHNDQLNVSAGSDHPEYTTRQKVKLNISAKNAGQPVEGNFSVAVVDESKVPYDEDSEVTILTNLLLTSDLKGFVEKPNYYFRHPDARTAADLDLLMQTQGYTRYSYDNILSDKVKPITFQPEQGIDLTGTLRASNGLPIFHGTVSLSIPDKNYYSNAETDPDGRFKFSNLVFLDSAKLKLSARSNLHASDLVLTADSEHPQAIPANLGSPDEIINIDSALNAYLKNSKIQYTNSHVLKEVVIKDTKIVKTVSHKDYGSLSSLSGEPDRLITADRFKGCNSVLECFKVAALGLTYQDGNFYNQRNYNSGKRTPVQVFVKGQPVDVSFLATADPNNIESIEIFLKDDLGMVNSTYNTDGAIVVNLKKVETQKISLSQLRSMLPQRNEIEFMPKGYAAIKIFYLPRYDVPRDKQPTGIDRRSTIYWNPNVLTDKTGNISLEYFNADGKGNYRITVEGIDKDGNIGRQVYRYVVK